MRSITINTGPYIVATGTTSSFLGDERLMREYIVGDHKLKQLQRDGQNAILYLINDSFDALNERQLRIAVNKDQTLIDKFKEFCGRPIAEIPDPYGCHESLAAHFIEALQKRLRALDIHPVVMDAHKAYKNRHYQSYIQTTFEHYSDIQRQLSERFDSYSMKNLFRAQCSKCLLLDATHIRNVVRDMIEVECDRCGHKAAQHVEEIQGKLSWKVDCAARWNLYGIDAEAFSKAHITDLGSFEVSRFLSEKFFGGKVPEALKYGEVKVSREMSYRLLEILPPPIFKQMFSDHQERDLEISKESVEHYCRRYEIKPDVSFVDFVKNELPVLAIKDQARQGQCPSMQDCNIDARTMITYGNRYSEFYYDKQHSVCLSGIHAIPTARAEVALCAKQTLQFALRVRKNAELTEQEQHEQIAKYMQENKHARGVFPYMRKVFAQEDGPGIATLLVTLPLNFLNAIDMAIGYFTSQLAPETEDKLVSNL